VIDWREHLTSDPKVCDGLLCAKDGILERVGRFDDAAFGLETLSFETSALRGTAIRHDGGLVIEHVHETRIRDFWRLSFAYRRSFGPRLALPAWKRWARAAAFPLVALMLQFSSFAKARQKPEYLWKFRQCNTMLFTTFLVRSAGESLGLVLGPGLTSVAAP
jgi:hypothetical protein